MAVELGGQRGRRRGRRRGDDGDGAAVDERQVQLQGGDVEARGRDRGDRRGAVRAEAGPRETAVMRLARLWWVMATALGCPVEPEV